MKSAIILFPGSNRENDMAAALAAATGRAPAIGWKIVLTYVVPYCVATYGAVTTRLEMMKREARA